MAWFIYSWSNWLPTKPPIYIYPHLPHAETASKSSRLQRRHWSNALDSATLQLDRTRECFELIESEELLDYDLPRRPNMTAGAILKHCYESLDKTLEKQKPCIFKVGFTHCAHFRFFNSVFGYINETDKWEKMIVTYASSEAISASYIEGAMIQRHKGSSYLCNMYVFSFFAGSPKRVLLISIS